MSEPAAKQRPSIDLGEFERRLRGPSRATRNQDDPLAELARLVGDSVPFKEPMAPIRRAAVQPRIVSPRDRHFDKGAAEAPSLLGDPGSHETSSEEPAEFATGPEPTVFEDEQYSSNDSIELRLRRPRRALYLMSAALILVFAGIAATFVMRGRALNGSEPPTIMAAAGPTKVPSKASDRVDVADRDASLLNRYGANDISSSRVVDHEEQPIALRTLRSHTPAGDNAANDATAGAAPPAAASYFPRPRLVHTVSVRPDGTIITDNSRVPIQSPVASPAPGPAGGATSATNPGATAMPLPAAAPATPVATTNVVNTPKAAAAGAINPRADTPPVSPGDATFASHLAPPPAPVKPTRAADQADAGNASNIFSASAPARGGYAVQLAAQASELQAETKMTRLKNRFVAELGGRNMVIEKADSNGHTFYRVRVVGLTGDDANILCSRLKAGGGACWVVRD